MAKLGTEKNAARGRVQSLERAQQILKICDDNGWKVVIGIEPDKPEDITEVNRLLYPPEPQKAEQKVGRNDPCPCGSGKKFKKCCMAK
jgi:SWIM/SEC-C metal-binding protein